MKPLFGQLAVDLGFLSEDEIERCAELQRTSTTYKPIGQVAIEKGFLNADQLEACLRLQVTEHKEMSLGQIATKQGFMTSDQVEQCSKEQLKSLNHKSIGQICLDNGMLTRSQVEEILNKQVHEEAISETEKPVSTAAPKPAEKPVSSTRPRVLVADDSPTIRHFVKISLHQFYEVTVVPNGNEALREVRNPLREPFDLLIFDIGLPDMSGFELCEVVKKLPRYRDVPLVVFTITTKPEHEEKARNSGVTELWEKKGLREVDLLRKQVRSALASAAGSNT